MHRLSVLPGRVRWQIPLLRDHASLALNLTREMETLPGVREATASSRTGTLLLHFQKETPTGEAEDWVRAALARALAAPPQKIVARVPAVRTTQSDPLGRIIRRAKQHQPLVATMLGASFVNRLLDSAPHILIGAGVDIVTRGQSPVVSWLGVRTARSQLFALGGLGLAAWAAIAVSDYLHRSSAAALAGAVRHDLRNEVYEHLQRLDIAQIESRDVSAWVNLLEGDVSRVHNFIKEGGDPIITILANSVALAATFLSVSPAFALAQALLVPPVLVVSKQLLGPLKERTERAQRDSDRLSAVIHGNVSALATITSFAAQDMETKHVAEAGEAQMVSARAANELGAAYVPTLKMIVGTGFMATLMYGVTQVQRGSLSPGAFNVVGAGQLRLLAAIGHFGGSLEDYQRTSVALQRIFTVLDLKPAITTSPHAVPFETVTREIVFEDVTFGYEPDRHVFRNLRLRFAAGQTCGIVGSSGAGKTTLLKLLLRFYDVQDGAVRFDGLDVRDVPLDDLRRSIAMVSQEVAVFAGTISDNIAYARPHARDADVRRAAEVAEAHEFISSLPEGYQTRVGYGGLTLSAGQRQRLAIARVVLADRPILLFDEATSALDYETEASVQRSLREVTAGRTTVIVAHRLSTIRHVDLIYVLDDGQVREQGRHDELLQADGIYASMWRVQTGEAVGIARRRTSQKGRTSRKK